MQLNELIQDIESHDYSCLFHESFRSLFQTLEQHSLVKELEGRLIDPAAQQHVISKIKENYQNPNKDAACASFLYALKGASPNEAEKLAPLIIRTDPISLHEKWLCGLTEKT